MLNIIVTIHECIFTADSMCLLGMLNIIVTIPILELILRCNCLLGMLNIIVTIRKKLTLVWVCVC